MSFVGGFHRRHRVELDLAGLRPRVERGFGLDAGSGRLEARNDWGLTWQSLGPA